MAEAPEEIVDELYGAPFDEFIARRDAAARELRREKRREEADAVKSLRKPALSAWAVNQLARSESDRLSGLLAAGAALRAARGGDALRDATHEERGAVSELASVATAILRDAGHPVSGKTADELRDTLHAAALDDEARELIERGRLVEPRRAVGLGGFGFGFAEAPDAAAPAEGEAAPKPSRGSRRRKPDKEAASTQEVAAPERSRGSRRREPDKGAASTAGDERATKAAAEDKRAAKAAAEEARAAKAAAKQAEREERARRREAVKAAREALREAEGTVGELEQEVNGLERALEDAREALDDARAEADRRRAALEEAG